MKTDLYQNVTDQIVSSLEQGVRPWMKPWNAEHAAGRITRPLRANGIAYQGINVLVLWSEAMARRLQRPDLDDLPAGAGTRAPMSARASTAAPVVYASNITRTGHGCRNGRGQPNATIPFLKSYTVFNVEQIEGSARAFPCGRRATA